MIFTTKQITEAEAATVEAGVALLSVEVEVPEVVVVMTIGTKTRELVELNSQDKKIKKKIKVNQHKKVEVLKLSKALVIVSNEFLLTII